MIMGGVHDLHSADTGQQKNLPQYVDYKIDRCEIIVMDDYAVWGLFGRLQAARLNLTSICVGQTNQNSCIV